MTCFIAQNELSAFADDALEMARASELQAHLSGCSNCTRELQEIRRVRTMLRALPVQRAPVDFLAKVKAKAQRKSFLERVGAAIEPLLRLPRPAQAGLALAASLVIAITVFLNPAGQRGSVWDSASAPGAARSLSEVANVQATSTPSALALSDFSKRTNLDGESQGDVAEAKPAPADEQQKLELAMAGAPAPPVAEAGGFFQDAGRREFDKKNDERKAPMAVAVPTGTAFRLNEATPSATSVPASRALVGSAGGGSSTGSTGNAAYSNPTSPGLYSSTPQTIVAAATPAPRPKVDAAGTKSGAMNTPNKLGKETSLADDGAEPAYNSSLAFAEEPTADSAPSGGDGWGSGSAGKAKASDPVEKARDAKDQLAAVSAKKAELRQDRDAAKTVESAGRAPATTEAPAGGETVAATSSMATAAPAGVAAPAPISVTVSAKFQSTAASAPQDVVAAAKAAGGKIVSPASAPPGLGKIGASTVVIVEIPAAGVTGFEEKLRLGGTFERGVLPSGTVRYRIEVVRQ